MGELTFVLIFGGVFFLTIREMEKVFRQMSQCVCMAPTYIFAGFFGVVFYATGKNLLVVAAFGMAMITATIIGQVFMTTDNYKDGVLCLLPYAYPILPEIAIVALFFALPEEVSKTLCYTAILCPEIGDCFAYFGGRLFGKHSLCSSISPKKTVEGAISAIPGAVLMALGLYYAQPLWNGQVELTVLLSMGLLCGIVGQFGDLYASIIKRAAGLKDFSEIIPGHGGLMDRLDSALLCATAIMAVAILIYF